MNDQIQTPKNISQEFFEQLYSSLSLMTLRGKKKWFLQKQSRN